MSSKMNAIPSPQVVTCEKFINSMMKKNEKLYSTKRSPASPLSHSNAMKQSIVVNNQRQKQKPTNMRAPNTVPKTTQLFTRQTKDNDVASSGVDSHRQRTPSRPRSRSMSTDRQPWGQVLYKNKDKMSTFSTFDPLRTVHFLTQELYAKIQTLLPVDATVLQMIADIQHALKRIPPEISENLSYPETLDKGNIVKPPTGNKSCQTPPTLYQEDTEKFQKIMEENTQRLEASCRQLEVVCTKLQKEKEMTEKELDEARENVETLCKKVRDLEYEMEIISSTKIKQLENEKEALQQELDKVLGDIKECPFVIGLKKHIEELQKQKSQSEETCSRLEYDMTLLKMEKEKFLTMLAVRDKEVKEIQEEMCKIQEQVNTQLKKLNIDMLPQVNSLKALSDPGGLIRDSKGDFGDGGDMTVSSMTTNESGKDIVNTIKDTPSGDGEIPTNVEDDCIERLDKLKASNAEIFLNNKECSSFEDLLKGLSPSCKTLLLSSNS